MTIRALRYAIRWEARIGEVLAAHVARQIDEHGWTKFVEGERTSFLNPMLGFKAMDGERIRQTLADATAPVALFEKQQKELALGA